MLLHYWLLFVVHREPVKSSFCDFFFIKHSLQVHCIFLLFKISNPFFQMCLIKVYYSLSIYPKLITFGAMDISECRSK